MMKKTNLFLVLLMALLVMSCSKDETVMSIPQESDAIAFGTYVGRDATTRATILGDALLRTNGFGVFAFYSNYSSVEVTNQYNDATSSNFLPNFMYNTKVYASESPAAWTYSPIKYWPNESDDKLTFFAYAPYSNGTQHNITNFSGNTATGDPTLKFTVNGVAKSQSDLLYADATTGLKNLTKQTINGKVNFPFKHALSRIGFKVEVMEDVVNDDATGTDDDVSVTSDAIASGTVVSVQKVELIGQFNSENTFNFATGNFTGASSSTTAAGSAAYTLNYNETDGDSNFDNEVAKGVTTSSQQLNADDSYLMIIPKEFTDAATEGLKISVTYKVKTTDPSLSAGYSEIENVITSEEFPFTFVKGMAYSFNLHLGLTSVKFSASVTDWDSINPAGTVVNVPINTGTNP